MRWAIILSLALTSACGSSAKLLGHPVHHPIAIVVRVSDDVANNDDGGAVASMVDAMLDGLRKRGLDGQVYAAPDEHPPAPRIEVRVGTADPGNSARRRAGAVTAIGGALARAPVVGVAGAIVSLSGAGSVRIECWVYEEGKSEPSFHDSYSRVLLGDNEAASAGESLGNAIMNSVFRDSESSGAPGERSPPRSAPAAGTAVAAASAPPSAAPADATTPATAQGRLPPEVIQRRIRDHYGAFRQCYEAGLARDPTLKGRISARFVIERDGKVTNVGDAGSNLPDPAVLDCVLSAFGTLTFPPPEGGIVTVVYPIMLEPG